jgi:excisionase family DNA binding protein
MVIDFDYIPSNEAAKLLGASRDSVVRLAERGKLRGVMVAYRWLVSREDVLELAKTYVPKVGRPRQKRKYTKRSERWFKNKQ